ncbi:crossover junction endonuclease EME1-like [Leptopilina heterotoma]|uniref:crossover junction endonuclease EME1-like n=1 Tax=Leptopilina heterotoma TaxID=63436 RepID=UPI001CA8723B|nr:crossover junction endonuclease EME1-like [Leptopilina heterotoma]
MDDIIVLSDSEDESVAVTQPLPARFNNVDDDFDFPEVNFCYEKNKKETYVDSAFGSFETIESNRFISRQNSGLSSEGSQDSAINIATSSKAKKAKIANEKKLERERKKEEKERQKAQKAVDNKNSKSMQPNECIKSMRIIIDGNLQTQPYFNNLISNLQKDELKFVVDSQPIQFSITWKRETEEHYLNQKNEQCSWKSSKDENELLIIWNCKDVLNKIADSTFIETIGSIVEFDRKKRVTLFIYGMKEYFAYHKNLKTSLNRIGVIAELGEDEPMRKQNKKDRLYGSAPTISKSDLDVNLCELQVLYNCSSRLINSQEDLSLAIYQFTKAIAEAPMKLEKYKNYDFCTDSSNSVAVNKDGIGLKSLWQQMLCQFDNCSLVIAEAICRVYESPVQLMEAYSTCTPKEGEMLLKDIPIRRAAGTITKAQKIGPQKSKRIYLMFTTEDGEVLLDLNTDNKK